MWLSTDHGQVRSLANWKSRRMSVDAHGLGVDRRASRGTAFLVLGPQGRCALNQAQGGVHQA